MLKFLATTILCILIHPLWAQEVSNVQVEQNGEELKVMFDLSGPKEKFDIQIEIAEDGQDFCLLGRMEDLPGKIEFRKQLKEPVFYVAGVFRVSAHKINFINDIDGNKYKTVKIGNQEWMAENLKVSKFRNGELVFEMYQKDEADVATYGKHYNFRQISDNRMLCPVGWHVPSQAEWYALVNYLDPTNNPVEYGWFETNIGDKLKAVSSLWKPHKSNSSLASNSSGFSALPAGQVSAGETFDYLGKGAAWWSSETSAKSFTLSIFDDKVGLVRSDGNDRYSVRCLRD